MTYGMSFQSEVNVSPMTSSTTEAPNYLFKWNTLVVFACFVILIFLIEFGNVMTIASFVTYRRLRRSKYIPVVITYLLSLHLSSLHTCRQYGRCRLAVRTDGYGLLRRTAPLRDTTRRAGLLSDRCHPCHSVGRRIRFPPDRPCRRSVRRRSLSDVVSPHDDIASRIDDDGRLLAGRRRRNAAVSDLDGVRPAFGHRPERHLLPFRIGRRTRSADVRLRDTVHILHYDDGCTGSVEPGCSGGGKEVKVEASLRRLSMSDAGADLFSSIKSVKVKVER